MKGTNLEINGSRLIMLPQEDTQENFLRGFWAWIEILASDDYEKAVESLYWEHEPWDPKALKQKIATFFMSGAEPFVPVIPNQRLINVVNENCETAWTEDGGWGLAQIPVTNTPERSKEDDVMLMGVAVSFFLRKYLNKYVMEMEIFHA